MIYQTGTAANINVVLTTLDSFLTLTAGYTQNMAPTVVGSGLRAHYQITTPRGNTLYKNFRSFRKELSPAIFTGGNFSNNMWSVIDGLASNLSKTYVGAGLNWDIQGGQPRSGDNFYQAVPVYAAAFDNVPAYHFFYNADPHFVAVVLEWDLGQYSWLMWGEPDSSGAGVFQPNNGYFHMGSCVWFLPFNYSTPGNVVPDPYGIYIPIQPPGWYSSWLYNSSTQTQYLHNQFFQLDPTLHKGADGWLGPTDDAFPYSTRNSTYDGSGYVANMMPGLITPLMTFDTSPYYRVPKYAPNVTNSPMRRSANSVTGVSVFLPHYFHWAKDQNNVVLLGQLPEVYHVFMRDLVPSTPIILGSDQWMFFPWDRKPNPFDPDASTPDYRKSVAYGTGFVIKMN